MSRGVPAIHQADHQVEIATHHVIDPAAAYDPRRCGHNLQPHLESRHLMNASEVTVLLVDDDKVDVMAVKRAFRLLNIEATLIEARNGIEALQHLRGENGLTKIVPPYLILLDLNMPRMGGLEFLDELRRDPDLRRSLTMVMTTSAAAGDRARAYDRNIAGYLLKHSTQDEFLRAISMLDAFCRTVCFPE
jgi:CheY-like chemotaxis protein